MRVCAGLLALFVVSTAVASPGEPVELKETAYAAVNGNAGFVVFEINWGRQWGCAGLDNAQLQALTFSQVPNGPVLELKTPSRLFVDDKYQGYAFIVEPGEYFLTDFDVKVAQSTRRVGHLIGKSVLFEDGQPIGGSFTVEAGEFVYVGHFSLDCAQEAIPWRYYVADDADFEDFKEGVREYYPFVGNVDIVFRPFETEMFGGPLPGQEGEE